MNNKLYPPKKENTAMELVTALATAVICVFLSGVIISHFGNQNASSYYNNNNNNYTNNETYNSDENNSDNQQYSDNQDNTNQNDNETIENNTTVDSNDDYILPYSNQRLLTESDLVNLTSEQLRYARNEIYARHGRMFDDEQLQAYFNSKSWYNGTISPKDFDDNDYLTDIEKQNRDFIVTYEKKSN